MDAVPRILIASGVLVGGALVAMLFRHPSPGTAAGVPDSGRQLVVRNCTPGVVEPAGIPPKGEAAGPATPAPRREAVVLTPVDSIEPPPLAKTYPGASMPAPAAWGAPASMLPQGAGQDGLVTRHKIVDGDTLRALAERYLGAADRWPEIFDANRELLSSPELLPIGGTLAIRVPRRAGPTALP